LAVEFTSVALLLHVNGMFLIRRKKFRTSVILAVMCKQDGNYCAGEIGPSVFT